RLLARPLDLERGAEGRAAEEEDGDDDRRDESEVKQPLGEATTRQRSPPLSAALLRGRRGLRALEDGLRIDDDAMGRDELGELPADIGERVAVALVELGSVKRVGELDQAEVAAAVLDRGADQAAQLDAD